MKIIIRLLSLSFLVFSTFTALSQEGVPEYTIQIGSFINPRPADFAQLQSLGFVYSAKQSNNYTNIYMGGFTNQAEAGALVEELKLQGFTDAFVSTLNIEGGQSATVIQLATKRVGDKFNWDELSKAGPLYAMLNGNEVKIATGIFPDVTAAKAQLARIQDLGFRDAFPKNVNNTLLHALSEFEMSNAEKRPLIPFDLAERPQPKQTPAPRVEIPTAYEEVIVVAATPRPKDELTPKGVAQTDNNVSVQPVVVQAPAPIEKEVESNPSSPVQPAVEPIALPEIRANVKRTSALELQKALKLEGIYFGSLDGYYGKETRKAYDLAQTSNFQLRKYSLLAKYLNGAANEAPKGSVQYLIDNLWDDPKTALDGLERSTAPLAKAYRAYFLFVSDGPGRDIDGLMNKAIKEAYADGKGAESSQFNPGATYSYNDINQLLQHIRYLHEASAEKVSAPCWLFSQNPGIALKAFGPQKGYNSNLKIGSCGGFWEWGEVRLLNAIVQDLGGKSQANETKRTASHSELAQLYLAPQAIGDDERKALDAWNTSLWNGIDTWAGQDPMLKDIATALRISYFQNWALFEDYFMNEGFNERVSRTLGLSALKALVGYPLERFSK